MKKWFSLFLLPAAILFACNKNTGSKPDNGFTGRFVATYASGNAGLTVEMGTAEFFPQPAPYNEQEFIGSRITVPAVNMNGQAMSNGNPQTDNNVYTAGTPNNISFGLLAGTSYSITGNNSVPTFSYNIRAPYPEILIPLPDSISRSAGYTINFPIGSYRYADSAFIVMDSQGGNTPATGCRLPGSISFAPSCFTGIVPDSLSVSITVQDTASRIVNGKRFLFTRRRSMGSRIALRP